MEHENEVTSSAQPSTIEALISSTRPKNNPIRHPILTSALSRPLYPMGLIDNQPYGITNDHNYQLTYPQPIASRQSQTIRHGIFEPWLSQLPKNETIKGVILYKPMPEWADSLPAEKYVRLRPRTHRSAVTTMAIYKRFLLIGLSQGEVILYDLNSMSEIRNYSVKHKLPITQIITGTKKNHFFVTSFNLLIEYSYNDEHERFRFTNQYYIKMLLTLSEPMLIVDSKGLLHCYHGENTGITVTAIPDVNLGEFSLIEELKYQGSVASMTGRPCLLIKKNCIAVVIIDVQNEPKLTLLLKKILTRGTDDTIMLVCSEEKIFYSLVENAMTNNSSIIYITKVKNLEENICVDYIKTTGGILTNMKATDSYLVTITHNQVEIFDIRSFVKLYHISHEDYLQSSIMIRNMLVLGTQNGSIICQNVLVQSDRVCLHCANIYFFEFLSVKKICFHFTPPENIPPPLLL